jgi:hypothetical protein
MGQKSGPTLVAIHFSFNPRSGICICLTDDCVATFHTSLLVLAEGKTSLWMYFPHTAALCTLIGTSLSDPQNIHCKKGLAIPPLPPSRDVTDQTLHGQE